jgi:tetratricopeptide (TPR) repeat protein
MEDLPENVKQGKKYVYKAKKMQKVGLSKEALEFLDKALQHDPDNKDALALKGTLLKDIKKYKESLDFFDRSITLSQHDSQSYFNKAHSHKELKMNEDALKNIEAA